MIDKTQITRDLPKNDQDQVKTRTRPQIVIKEQNVRIKPENVMGSHRKKLIIYPSSLSQEKSQAYASHINDQSQT